MPTLVDRMDVQKQAQLPQEAFREIGSSGASSAWGDASGEFLRELRGSTGIKTYNEMQRNDAIVGASLFTYINLIKEVSFEIVSADPGNNAADQVAEFINGALFEDMSTSWPDTLEAALSFLGFGWSWLEVVYKRRMGESNDPTRNSRFNDNKIGWRKWAPRPQRTWTDWDVDEAGGVQALLQRAAPSYIPRRVPIEKSLFFRAGATDSTEGTSILRAAYIPWYHKRRLQIIRGIGIERDLAGLPIITPPEGVDIWNPNDPLGVAALARAEKVVRNIRRDENEGVVKPFGWTLELLASSGGRQFDITQVIGQLNAEIAMSMMTDFLLVGHEKVGARSVATDKRATFALAAASFLKTIVAVINRFAIRPLVHLNGWTEELTPTLQHGPVAELSLNELTEFISKMTSAGVLLPDEDLETHVRERGQLPPAMDRISPPRPSSLEE